MDQSTIFGWLSTLIWSASFYPQIYLNFVNRSTYGLCIDYAVYNFLGFSSYTYYNILAFSDINDLFFSFHGMLMCSVVLIQMALYSHKETVSYPTLFVIFAVLYAFIFNIDNMDLFGAIKVLISFVKYLPQMYLNFINQSTNGFSTTGVIVDLAGCTFSALQILTQPSQIYYTNLVKFMIIASSTIYDVIFICQYLTYQDTTSSNDLESLLLKN